MITTGTAAFSNQHICRRRVPIKSHWSGSDRNLFILRISMIDIYNYVALTASIFFSYDMYQRIITSLFLFALLCSSSIRKPIPLITFSLIYSATSCLVAGTTTTAAITSTPNSHDKDTVAPADTSLPSMTSPIYPTQSQPPTSPAPPSPALLEPLPDILKSFIMSQPQQAQEEVYTEVNDDLGT